MCVCACVRAPVRQHTGRHRLRELSGMQDTYARTYTCACQTAVHATLELRALGKALPKIFRPPVSIQRCCRVAQS